ncbi:MAG: DUF2231 domain-containing protein [Balneolaceae bacterium]|nr:DUF2231 domain-containing protein [Balneolaceae bacterium]
MNELPGIWRTELWHPMVVHFPIVLLLGAAVLRMLSKFFAEEKSAFLKNTSRLSLYIGVVTAWIAIYTGSLADSIVVRELCDPTVLEDHENAAFTLGYIFTASVLFDSLDLFSWHKLSFLKKPFIEWIVIGLLLTGTVYLGYTAHLGATLVYQQSAAVYQPTEGCVEFE